MGPGTRPVHLMWGGRCGKTVTPHEKPFSPPPPSLAFLPVKWKQSGAKIHSGICQFLKQKITSLTFAVLFRWFQFHGKEMKELK